MADRLGTVATFTIDHLAYSPSPPVIAVVVDFDGGGRFSCELTDADPAQVAIGDRVEMTFRRISHRRRRAQLLLEGSPMGRRPRPQRRSDGFEGSAIGSPSSGWAAPTSASTGTRASTTC